MIALKYREPPLAVWRRCLKPMVGADLIGSTILIAFVNLVQGVDGAAVKAAAAGIGAVAVGMLLVLITRTRQMAEALAERERRWPTARPPSPRGEALAESARARRGARRDDPPGRRRHRDGPGLVGMVDLRDRYTARLRRRRPAVPAAGRRARMVARGRRPRPPDRARARHRQGGAARRGAAQPGRPTPEEWDLIHQHAGWGADILAHMRLMPAAVDGCAATTSAGTAAATRSACGGWRSRRSAGSSPSATPTTP